ncbi:uncharacterized protein [Palaemon carinicauda]|uniref:uncharacterized protein n=1 Tax=Palaemon carinicauda TaxID=392227 RepID=UPI0035B5DF82
MTREVAHQLRILKQRPPTPSSNPQTRKPINGSPAAVQDQEWMEPCLTNGLALLVGGKITRYSNRCVLSVLVLLQTYILNILIDLLTHLIFGSFIFLNTIRQLFLNSHPLSNSYFCNSIPSKSCLNARY